MDVSRNGALYLYLQEMKFAYEMQKQYTKRYNEFEGLAKDKDLR